jgi:hypothetical protein
MTNKQYHYSVEHGPLGKRRSELHSVFARTEEGARKLLADRHLDHVGVKITLLTLIGPDRQK